MRLNQSTTIPPALFSMTTQSAVIQIVSTSRGIVLDVQATNVATDGRPYQSHAIAKLALDEAMRLETVLASAVDAAWGLDDPITELSDPRQTALWSNATFTAPVRRAA